MSRRGAIEAVFRPTTPPTVLTNETAALRRAVVRAIEGRGRRRRGDEAEALRTWQALLTGRASVIDSFDHDGRRYLVVLCPHPGLRLAELTSRERQVVGYACRGHSNKLIAYELGLSSTTVATHLGHAATKLGARSRVELIRLCLELALDGAQLP